MKKKIIGVIPARYASSRFPGKPLMDICGKPMVKWVYDEALKVKELDEVYVASEDDRVLAPLRELGVNVIKTKSTHSTGTDRVVEVSENIEGDIFCVLMGDEPLIRAEDISKLVNTVVETGVDAGMLMIKFTNPVDAINPTTIKLALNSNNEVIFMSRAPIPFPKGITGYPLYKNVGTYIFTRSSLELFKNNPVGRIEEIEELEMLRVIEQHKIVSAVEASNKSLSVDTPKDLEVVRKMMKERIND